MEQICNVCTYPVKGNFYTCECSSVLNAVMHHTNGIDGEFKKEMIFLPYEAKTEIVVLEDGEGNVLGCDTVAISVPRTDCHGQIFCSRRCHDRHTSRFHGLIPNSFPEKVVDPWEEAISSIRGSIKKTAA